MKSILKQALLSLILGSALISAAPAPVEQPGVQNDDVEPKTFSITGRPWPWPHPPFPTLTPLPESSEAATSSHSCVVMPAPTIIIQMDDPSSKSKTHKTKTKTKKIVTVTAEPSAEPSVKIITVPVKPPQTPVEKRDATVTIPEAQLKKPSHASIEQTDASETVSVMFKPTIVIHATSILTDGPAQSPSRGNKDSGESLVQRHADRKTKTTTSSSSSSDDDLAASQIVGRAAARKTKTTSSSSSSDDNLAASQILERAAAMRTKTTKSSSSSSDDNAAVTSAPQVVERDAAKKTSKTSSSDSSTSDNVVPASASASAHIAASVTQHNDEDLIERDVARTRKTKTKTKTKKTKTTSSSSFSKSPTSSKSRSACSSRKTISTSHSSRKTITITDDVPSSAIKTVTVIGPASSSSRRKTVTVTDSAPVYTEYATAQAADYSTNSVHKTLIDIANSKPVLTTFNYENEPLPTGYKTLMARNASSTYSSPYPPTTLTTLPFTPKKASHPIGTLPDPRTFDYKGSFLSAMAQKSVSAASSIALTADPHGAVSEVKPVVMTGAPNLEALQSFRASALASRVSAASARGSGLSMTPASVAAVSTDVASSA